jgi:hypothetical protein
VSRSLFYKTSAELDQMAERNKKNKAELKLVIAECRNRQSINARQIIEKAEAYIRKIDESEKSSRPNVQKILDSIESLARKSWDRSDRLKNYLDSARVYTTPKAKTILRSCIRL